MKVLRLTRHPATPEQLAELRRIFAKPGEFLEIVEISETVPDAGRVKALVEEHGAGALEAVLPMPILADLTNPKSGLSVPVIRAITRRELSEDGTKTAFAFSHYEKVIKVEVLSERL